MLAFIRLLKVQLISNAVDEFWGSSEMSVGSQSEDTYDRRYHKRCSAPVVMYNSADQGFHQDAVGVYLKTSTTRLHSSSASTSLTSLDNRLSSTSTAPTVLSDSSQRHNTMKTYGSDGSESRNNLAKRVTTLSPRQPGQENMTR